MPFKMRKVLNVTYLLGTRRVLSIACSHFFGEECTDKMGDFLQQNTNNVAAKDQHISYCVRSTSGFTLFELLTIVAILGILSAISGAFLIGSRKTAYEITIKHDLQIFARVQEGYFAEHDTFVGSNGQSIRSDGVDSDFELEGFSPSKGVCITITSGDPGNPFDPGNPYIAEGKHNAVDSVFEYNFLTKTTTKK